MALTNANKVDIRFYLGYPAMYFHQNPRLESALKLVSDDADTSAKVLDILDTLNTKIKQTLFVSLQEVGVSKVDSGSVGNGGVEYHSKLERDKGLRAQGRMYCSQLSNIFGVPLQSDPFDDKGYQGDGWKGGSGNSNGFGFKLGHF